MIPHFPKCAANYDQGETRHTGTGTPSKHYYTKDHLGTIHGITSGTGTVEASFRYDPYGLRTDILSGGSTPSDRGYTGHWYFKPSTTAKAAAKEMYLTWYRMYDPVHGRWLSRDPIGENGGLNLYGYVGNGPIGRSDRHGLSFIDSLKGLFSSCAKMKNQAKKCLTKLSKAGKAAEDCKKAQGFINKAASGALYDRFQEISNRFMGADVVDNYIDNNPTGQAAPVAMQAIAANAAIKAWPIFVKEHSSEIEALKSCCVKDCAALYFSARKCLSGS